MAEDTGAAPAAAEQVAAPVDEPIVDVPNPIETVDEPARAEPKADAAPKAPTTREALDKAFAKVEAQQKAEPKDAKPAPKAEAKEPAKEPPARDDTGKFAAKDKPAEATAAKPATEQAPPAKSTYEPPKRFSDDARKVYDSAPEPVKAEIARMERELTQGIEKHREKAAKYDAIQEFDDMATRSGTTVKDALSRYVSIETKLRGDLVGGLDEIVSNATQGKMSLRDVAAHLMGQTPEQNQSQDAATIRELKHTVAQLQQQIGGVTETIQQQQQREHQQRETATLEKINAWAADKPLFELLAPHIADEMRGMEAPDLDAAYKAVLQKHPQLVALSAPGKKEIQPEDSASPAKLDLAEQIRKGSKSPTGAPTPGSDPATRKPSKTNREALDRAFAALA